MSDEFEVDQADAGAAQWFPQQASAVKKGGHIMIKGRPCKVVNISTSKPGKHGSAKCNFTAIDLFTGDKKEAISPGHANVDVPFVNRVEYTVLDIDDSGFFSLMANESGDMREDIRCPEDGEGEKARNMFNDGKEVMVTILTAIGEDKLVDCKENTKNN